MAVEIILRRERGRPGLHSVTAHDDEALSAIPFGKDFTATLRQKRSLPQSRFYWALLGRVVANHPFYRRAEALHLFLKTRLGYVESIEFHDGTMHTRVSSTAFDKMDGFEMRTYMDLALGVLCEEVISGMDRGALLDEIERVLGTRFEALFPRAEAT